ncbi:acetyl-CoA C-acetyltransferase [Xanthobacter dioxanivorans]|uniref:Acetyl-CoA C-acetyltransferase n=1 Tax=Xanthobacter dioxanivorans TaxID=2528964 RepID=A0A974PR31_9HYPH|nr:acetyl-CoA C-acetyltransferase [Xanthobacter dioxanivorans]QRG07788.1 acetyl-CoA C-acetyltransferase [Xanthobacter dioxanivorans]
MPDAYILDHVRTPRGRGKPDGGLHAATPVHLASTVLTALRARGGLDTALVSDIVMGVVMPVGEQGQCLPRLAALHAGYAQEVAGVQVNRFCGSGLEATNMAAAKVMAGQADLAIGGGCESMSRIPILSDGGAWSTDPQVSFASYFVPQGISADLIATKWGYTRAAVDAFAVESHRRAARAWSEGRFARSVVAVRDRVGEVMLERDETVRGNSTVADLARLKPSFAAMGAAAGFDDIARLRYPEVGEIAHVHHAGNASGVVDGAAAILVGTREAGAAAGLTPRARIRAFAEIGSEPTIMLTAPAFAAEKALKRAGMSARDVDIFEVNEAFAAVALRFIEALDLDPARVNVNGGAIAMGHPLGATGAMILGTALDELERSGGTTALVTLCIGAGMGVATIIERV